MALPVLALAGLAAAVPAPTLVTRFNGVLETPVPSVSATLHQKPYWDQPYPWQVKSLASMASAKASAASVASVASEKAAAASEARALTELTTLWGRGEPTTTLPVTPFPSFTASPVPSSISPSSLPDQDETEIPLDHSLSAFENNPFFSRLADAETAPYPYSLVFADQNATAIHQPIESHVTSDYNAGACAARCNEHRACRAFGVFIERVPSCVDCVDDEDVQARERIVCELYNTVLEEGVVRDGETEVGTEDGMFTRAVRASNGYNRLFGAGVEGEVQRVTETVVVTQTVTVPGETETQTQTATVTMTPIGIFPAPSSLLSGATTTTALSTVTHTTTEEAEATPFNDGREFYSDSETDGESDEELEF